MTSNYALETDVKEVVAMSEALEDYVRGDDLYGKVGGFFSRIPSLTVGALLLRLRRLDALRDQLQDHQTKRLDTAVDTYASVRREWRQHYEQKMLQEAHSRIDGLQTYFEECDDNPAKCAEYYRPEMQRRTIVQEILKEMHDMNIRDDALLEKVSKTDKQLHALLKADTFQWAEVLQPVYPESEFWWLYQTPQTNAT